MPKFFIEADELQNGRILLKGKNADHLKVLRPKEGELLNASDGKGAEFLCRYSAGFLEILSEGRSSSEPGVRAVVYCGLPKGDKAETIVQKSVELGAGDIVFFASSRCVAKLDSAGARKKLERWNRIAEEAAMQSYRGRIPEVRWLPSFEAMLKDASAAQLACFLWEGEHTLSLKRALRDFPEELVSASLITGPEGGFSAEEAEAALRAGIRSVTVGPRILRCETAPLCALSALMYETDNLE